MINPSSMDILQIADTYLIKMIVKQLLSLYNKEAHLSIFLYRSVPNLI